LKLWFEQYPERLDYELQALRDAGYTYTLDEAKKSAGQVVITVEYPFDGEFHLLTAHFPEFYPYLPLEIYGPSLPPGKHICPSSGLLCLMQDLQSTWKTSDTLALMLAEKVTAILNAHSDPQNAEEAQEGTQRSGQYPYNRNSVLLTEDWEIPKHIPFGKLVIGLESWPNPLRGTVLEVQDAHGLVLAKIAPVIAKRYQTKIRGRWQRLNAPPRTNGGGPLEDAINVVASVERLKLDSGVDVVGLLFPEESSYQTFVENWIFTVRTRNWTKSRTYDLIRSESISPSVMKARVPALGPLEHKKVFIVGVGAIGSMIAWQLARSGVGMLNLLDQDFVQTGNLPRWMLGLPAVGQGKAQAMANYLKSSYPFTEINYLEYSVELH
jgi:ubiquitin-protein ligase